MEICCFRDIKITSINNAQNTNKKYDVLPNQLHLRNFVCSVSGSVYPQAWSNSPEGRD